MNHIKEMREKLNNGHYNLTLEMADSTYFERYEDVDKKSGEDLIRNYLNNNSDDANFDDIKIKYNKNRHTVRVTTELNYDDGIHKDYENRGRLM